MATSGQGKRRNLSGAPAFPRLLRLCLAGLTILGCSTLAAEPAPTPDVFMPSFFDRQRRFPVPDMSTIKIIRFLTDDEFPPFQYLGPDGALTGFNVEIARAVCEELKVACTIQARRWDTLLDALAERSGDAVIASLKDSDANRARVDFSAPYYLTPGRFIALVGAPARQVLPETLIDVSVGVEAGSAHEAFLRKFYRAARLVSFSSAAEMHTALKNGEIELAFGDAPTLAIWMNGADSENCCAFRGGPFLEPAFFGNGVGVALRKGDAALRRALDYALQRLDERGAIAELYLKYFPIGIY